MKAYITIHWRAYPIFFGAERQADGEQREGKLSEFQFKE